jgi:nucleoside phosphorylase
MSNQHLALKWKVLILTSHGIECQAVLAYLSATQEIIHPQGTIYYQGTFPDQQHAWSVVVAEIGMGGSAAAIETERAIHFFRPEITFFVGIADALKDVQLGDVIAATKVYNYEVGKASARFEARPEVWRTSYALEQRARAEAQRADWLARLNNHSPGSLPHVFIGALAAGEKIIASKRSDVYQILRATYGDALAVEMEGHGFLQAVRANHMIQALVVRGIAHLIDDTSEDERDYSQQRAAHHAAAFAFEVLAKFNGPGQANGESKDPRISSRANEGNEDPCSDGDGSPTASGIKEPGKHSAFPQRKIFISYSRKDAKWLERLQVHLAPIEQEGLLDLWGDTKIVGGSLWQASLLEALETASVAITLVSADFLASPFVVQCELPKLLSRVSSGGLMILPIIVSPCLFTSSGLSVFQAANDPQKPLSSMTLSERERMLVNAAKVIRKRLMEENR